MNEERTEEFLLLNNKEKVIQLLRLQRKHFIVEISALKLVLSENLEKNKLVVPKMESRLEMLKQEVEGIDKDLKLLEGQNGKL